jgi:hypothetical protein
MPQHVRVDLHIETSSLTGSFNHRLKATPGERCSSLTGEYERGLRLLRARCVDVTPIRAYGGPTFNRPIIF